LSAKTEKEKVIPNQRVETAKKGEVPPVGGRNDGRERDTASLQSRQDGTTLAGKFGAKREPGNEKSKLARTRGGEATLIRGGGGEEKRTKGERGEISRERN